MCRIRSPRFLAEGRKGRQSQVRFFSFWFNVLYRVACIFLYAGFSFFFSTVSRYRISRRVYCFGVLTSIDILTKLSRCCRIAPKVTTWNSNRAFGGERGGLFVSILELSNLSQSSFLLCYVTLQVSVVGFCARRKSCNGVWREFTMLVCFALCYRTRCCVGFVSSSRFEI